MEKIITYKFDHEHKIIYEKIKGRITFNDIISFEKSKLGDPEHNDSYSVFVDIRGAFFELSEEEEKTIFSLLQETTAKANRNRKCAFITGTPSEAAKSEIFLMKMKEFSPMSFKVFSTEEAAFYWLLKDGV